MLRGFRNEKKSNLQRSTTCQNETITDSVCVRTTDLHVPRACREAYHKLAGATRKGTRANVADLVALQQAQVSQQLPLNYSFCGHQHFRSDCCSSICGIYWCMLVTTVAPRYLGNPLPDTCRWQTTRESFSMLRILTQKLSTHYHLQSPAVVCPELR
jgi:hypothetical protein